MITKKCIELVFSTRPGDFKPRRCSRAAGHGKNGDYCGNHAKSSKDIGPLSAKPVRRKPVGGGRRS